MASVAGAEGTAGGPCTRHVHDALLVEPDHTAHVGAGEVGRLVGVGDSFVQADQFAGVPACQTLRDDSLNSNSGHGASRRERGETRTIQLVNLKSRTKAATVVESE